MKYMILATGFAVVLGAAQFVLPTQAQTADEIKRICYNKYNLGKYASAASEAQRKENAARYAACVRNKGNS